MLAAALVLAVRFTVLAADAKPVSDAEICIAKGSGFAIGEIRCDREAAVPDGEWIAFARRGKDEISDAVTSAEGTLRLVSATRTLWPVAEGESRFVYVPRTRSVIPIVDRVPADTFVIPLTVKNAQIVRVGNEPANGAALVVPVRIERAPKGKAAPPNATVTDAAGRIHKPVTGIANIADGMELVFFRDVPAGAVTVRVGGERWKTATASIDANAPVVTVAQPLVTTPTQKLIVNWWLANDPTTIVQSTPPCDAKPADRVRPRGEKFQFSLVRCAGSNCTPVVTRALPLDRIRGVVELEDIPLGRYRMDMEYPHLETFWKQVEVTEDGPARTDYEVWWRSFSGRVTRGGRPLHARVFETVTDPETGEYQAAFERLPTMSETQIITPCDGSPAVGYVLDSDPVENGRFDIDFPDNRVPVDVTDEATGAPLPKAWVSVTAFRKDSEVRAQNVGTPQATDANGHIELGPVLTNRMVMVCAQHGDYERACSERFSMDGVSEKAIRLALKKAEQHPGRVVVNGEIGLAFLQVYRADGSFLESVPVRANGSFRSGKPHVAGEIIVFISRSHPMYAFVLPGWREGETWEIRVPNARARSFTVTLPKTASPGQITIALGDLVVPGQAVSMFAGMRNAQTMMLPGQTVTIPEVLETAPIAVIHAPAEYLRGRAGNRADPVIGFVEGRSLRRYPLGGATSITIE